MKKRFTILLIILFSCISITYAQETFGFRKKTLMVSKHQTNVIDSLVIIPESFSFISKTEIDSSIFHIDYFRSFIRLKPDSYLDSIEIIVQYQTLKIHTNQSFQKKDKSYLFSKMEDPQQFFRIRESKNDLPWLYADSELQRSGSISRGISAGNSQNVIVNSDMNLQLNGKLNESFNIRAAITDRNIPLQPDGNTQQLQDFDQVYIQLYNKTTQISAGDFELKNEPNHFLRFNKKLLGGALEHTQMLKDSSSLLIKTAVSVSKGKYIRQEIKPMDGNQGPYKLVGENNESFILVLAGSEKVYIDGVLKERGELNDYTIDYNLGEIYFSPRTIMTKEKRILVEFEYSDKNYSRTFTHNHLEHNTRRNRSFISYYVEKDLKNQSIQPQLDDAQKFFLSTIGDRTSDALYLNIDSLAFSSNEIRYKKIDTLVNGIYYDSVFVYSTNPDSAYYRIGFTQVGKGKGNYTLESNLANGRVFRWIAPINGLPQGDYEPIMALNPPKHTQILSLGNVLKIGKKAQLKTEMAYSSLDKNTFSKLDSKDNQGLAGLIEYSIIHTIKTKDTANIWNVKGDVAYEYVSRNFNEIEPFRDVEFARNFGLTNFTFQAQQHSTRMKISIQNQNHLFLWGIQNMMIEKFYSGFQNQWNHHSKLKRFSILNEGIYLTGKRDTLTNKLLNYKSEINYDFKILKAGVIVSGEGNLHKNQITDSLNSNSNGFNQIEFYISQADSSKNEYKIHILRRTDQIPDKKVLVAESQSDELGFRWSSIKHDNHNLNSSLIYRNRVFLDTIYGQSESILGSTIDYSGLFLKKTIKFNTFYEASGGQEQKRDFYYLKVAKGTGNFVWKDYNGNNIEELDEFEQAVFADEGEYIKLWRMTNDYIQTFNSRFNQNIQISAPLDWHKRKDFKGFIARFSNHLNFKSDKKLQNNALLAYNPFAFTISDTDLVSINQSLRNSFVINQRSPLWSHEIIYSTGTSKMFLTGGFEKRIYENLNNVLRIVFFKKITSKTDIGIGEKQYLSDQFSMRNNKINHLSFDQSSNVLFSTNFRWIFGYKYMEKKNETNQMEKLFSTTISSELTYNITNKGILNWKVSFIKNVFHGNPNQAIAFEMMEGLVDGFNFITSVNIQTNLGQNLQLNGNYEGRYSETSKIIHIGNITLRAYF